MDYPAYKRIDTIPKLLEYMWSLFPNIVAIQKGEQAPLSITEALDKKLYQPVIENSVEFCDLLSKNILKIQPFAQGGFGQVGLLTIDEDVAQQPLKAIVISFKRAGGFEPFYVPVIIKLYLTNEEPRWSIGSGPKDQGFFYISDPLSEMIFGSMLGHLYDLGLCPFFTKYFGAYICKGEKTSIVTEKASLELRRLISRNRGVGIAQKHPDAVINLLFQYVYGLFIMKTYYGMVHFDTQHRNIMATYIHNRQIKIAEHVQSYIYQGEDISKKDLFLFQTHVTTENLGIGCLDDRGRGLPVFICIKNYGLLLKIIDYGVCVSHLKRSKINAYKNDITISSIPEDLKRIGAAEAFLNTIAENGGEAYSNTVDLVYTLINMWEHMIKGLDTHTGQQLPDPVAPRDYRDALLLLDSFSEKFFGEEYRLSSYLERHPERKVQTDPKRGLVWVSRAHDTGIRKPAFSDPKRLLEGLLNVCGKDKHIRTKLLFKGQNQKDEACVFYLEPEIRDYIKKYGLQDKNTMLLMNEPSERDNNMNLFSNYVSSSNLVRDMKCNNLGKGETEKIVKCKQLKTNIMKFSLDSLASKKLYNPSEGDLRNSLISAFPGREKSDGSSRSSSSSTSGSSAGSGSTASIDHLPNSNLVKRTPIFDYYQIQINPAALKLNRDSNGAQVYQQYQSWFDFKSIKEKRIGDYVETIFLHIFKLRGKNIFLSKKTDLWSGALKYFDNSKNGLAINGGYFIVPGNINYLYPNLTMNDVFEPIGYSYSNRENFNGTKLSFPPTYHDDLGFVYGRKNGSIYVEEYNEFMNKHLTMMDVIRYETKESEITNEKKILEETVSAIAMTPFLGEDVDTSLIGPRPFKADGTELTDDDYIWAFCSGPFLIKNGVVVFTEQKMNTELMVAEDTLVHAVPDAKNSYKYRSAEDEGNQFYGMRHSHRYMVHNVLAIDNNNKAFIILCEGRGFDSPGLDRVQLANLIHVLNVKTALSLDGGFSANAVYKDCSTLNNGVKECKPMFALNDPEKRKLGVSMYIM
ncbi:serine/threonine protein kinase [Armadillidium vulgare iridescent virus]|uniref:Serine/threonine protein kinase n=1 Tax=Armadillidium vulgare iridescent virus TaxID=72201 RepID=A0A068QKH3_9VIRU|nr:serine/threonine protein kinase [Armadillidium vulgare iridescent virus]CCV02532.1 serine/threonine protein kinase [Armadillidium vulgare iridescent virus]